MSSTYHAPVEYQCAYCKKTFNAAGHPVYKFHICPFCNQQAFTVEAKGTTHEN